MRVEPGAGLRCLLDHWLVLHSARRHVRRLPQDLPRDARASTPQPRQDRQTTNRHRVSNGINKKHLKNVAPVRHCEPPHAIILHCHSPSGATVARRLRIDVHDNDDNDNDNNDNA